MAFTSAFVQAIIVAFREGLEAVLLLAALAAYATKSGFGNRIYQLAIGAAVGLGLSMAFALAISATAAVRRPEILEAVLVLGGSVLMLHMSGWMWVGRQKGPWHNLVLKLAGGAKSANANVALLPISLLITLREGLEVALFGRALMYGPGGAPGSVVAGLAIGVAALLIVYAVVRKLSLRLPLRLLFLVTSGCLFIIGLKLVGEGIGVLQEAHMLRATAIPDARWLLVLGINATWEAVLVQIMITALAITGLITFCFSVNEATDPR